MDIDGNTYLEILAGKYLLRNTCLAISAQKYNWEWLKPIWQKFTEEPLKINPYFLTPEQLIEKNKAIIESRKGTLLFRELVSTFYLKSLPEDFKTKF